MALKKKSSSFLGGIQTPPPPCHVIFQLPALFVSVNGDKELFREKNSPHRVADDNLFRSDDLSISRFDLTLDMYLKLEACLKI